MSRKKEHGVFYTKISPFSRQPFMNWVRSIPDFQNRVLVEPFAGENGIPAMLNEYKNAWVAQDIAPPGRNLREDIKVRTGNSLVSYPACDRRSVAITNPPYLAKNSAVRAGLKYHGGEDDDLYKRSIRVMLERHDYVAAIIPASFLTANMFEKRIMDVDLMVGKYFDDTDHPVCLVMFGPEAERDWGVWKEGNFIGSMSELRRERDKVIGRRDAGIRFNDVNGQISLLALDKPKGGRIKFGPSHLVRDDEIKVSSRVRTKIFIEGLADPERIVYSANRILEEFRRKTGDVFLTPYRGVRDDGDFRRRLDFAQAAAILTRAMRDDRL